MGSASDPLPPYRRRQPSGQPTPFILGESLWGLDWISLRLSSVYRGEDVPQGDGSAVVIVPGFLATDTYLHEMRSWLRRIGYSPFSSGIGINLDCIEGLTRRLEDTVSAAHHATGRPVRLIGHSLGGVLARRLAIKRPDIVGQLISLATPIRGLQAHPVILAAARFVGRRIRHLRPTGAARRGRARRLTDLCECLSDWAHRAPPPSVGRVALYTRADGVIPWRNCLEPETELNHEVGGTHVGMAFNPRAYRVIATVLAEATASHSPTAPTPDAVPNRAA